MRQKIPRLMAEADISQTPNKALEPTPGSVMPRATAALCSEAAFREARGTPAPVVAHL
jgi:hypothetical protein